MEIEAKNLFKSYGNVQAVKDFSFKTESGKIYGIIGPNGAGKTTTLRILSGLTKATAGEIKIFGQSLEKNSLWAKT
ncbi:MAG: ATP-binding cassette domain-containing protein, partial [Spirochaetota bacterium]